MELVKNVGKWGNSAGILLPKEWLGNQVKAVLIERTLDIKKEIFEILSDYLDNILGIYLVGSYARNEQTKDSDIDILVITKNLNKKLKSNKYEIIMISQEELKKQLEENALPVLAMLREARAIINSELIENYKSSKLTGKNIRYHLETTKSAMKVVEEDIKLSKELNQMASDASAYSLILRLRTLYLIDRINKNKSSSKKEFLKLVKKIAGSLNAYNRYVSSKNKNTFEYKLEIKQAKKLLNYINKKIFELENALQNEKT